MIRHAISTCIALTPLVALLPHGAFFPPPPPPPPPPYHPPGLGYYNGPGDTRGRPASPAPSGPSTGTGATGPSTPGSVSTGGARAPGAPSVPTGATSLEPTSWELWWRYNRDAYLDLKWRVELGGPATAGDTLADAEIAIAFGIESALTALARERQRDLVSSLLVGVARACDGAAHTRGAEIVRRLEPFVADPDQEVGETAAAALGILRHHAGLEDLAALLHDDEVGRKLAGGGRVSSRTRAFAAYGLGIAAARSELEESRVFAVHHLERALESSHGQASIDIAAACVIALGIAPPSSDEAAGPIRVGAKRVASNLPPRSRSARAAVLLRTLRDASRPETVRAHAPDALAHLALEAEPELRAEIARELVTVVQREARENATLVRGAVLALGRLADCDEDAADVDMRGALVQATRARDAHARYFALISLANVAARRGSTSRPGPVHTDFQTLLLDRLANGSGRERPWAALALGILERGRADMGRSGSPNVRTALRRALGDATAPDQVGALAIAIGLCADRAATPELLKRLGDVSDPVGRGHIATALGILQAPEAIEPLRAVLSKSRFQPDLLRETAIALALLGDNGLESALLEELRNAKSLSSQAGVARALGFAGTLASVEPLTKMLGDSSLTAGARAFSAVALGMVCDRERTPWNAFLSIGVNYPSAPPTLSDGSAGILDIL